MYLLQQGSKRLPARVPLETVSVNISTSDLNIGIGETPIKHNIHEEAERICKHVGGQEQNSKQTETVKRGLEN